MTMKRVFSLLVALAILGVAVKIVRGRSSTSSTPVDHVEEWGKDSFPASDPPGHW